MMCAADPYRPAVIDRELCGIVSWELNCGSKLYPGVYVDINHVKPFIESVMETKKYSA